MKRGNTILLERNIKTCISSENTNVHLVGHENHAEQPYRNIWPDALCVPRFTKDILHTMHSFDTCNSFHVNQHLQGYQERTGHII